ncbi:acyltransferase family protein [Paraburkholderia sp. 2C]
MKIKNARIDDIQVLRAVAVLLTMFEHLQYLLPDPGKFLSVTHSHFAYWAGVDLFFAISGYVIARNLFARLACSGSISEFWRISLTFWTRRAFRIWPSSWFWLIVLAVCSVVFEPFHIFHPLRTNLLDLFASVLQVQNFHMWDCIAHNAYQRCGDAGSWWSLSLEEQFYLALPFIVFFLGRYALLLVTTLVVVQLSIPREAWTILWAIRSDALGLGVLLAAFESTNVYGSIGAYIANARNVIAALCVMLFYVLIAAPVQTALFMPPGFSTGIVALASAGLVFVASYDQNILARGPLKNVWLWIGSRSYGIYLIHWPMVTLTKIGWKIFEPSEPHHIVRYVALWLTLSFGFAELNYRFLEEPLRKRGKLIVSRRRPSTNYQS